MRTAENSMARNYTRRSLIADLYTLHGNWDAARTYKDMPATECLKDISDIIHSGLVKGELLDRFYSCLIAERYLRRLEYRTSQKIGRAA